MAILDPKKQNVNTQVSDTTGGTVAGPVSPGQGTAGSGLWTNLNRYIDLNQGKADEAASNIIRGFESKRQGIDQRIAAGPGAEDRDRWNAARSGEVGAYNDEVTRLKKQGVSEALRNAEGGRLSAGSQRLNDFILRGTGGAQRIRDAISGMSFAPVNPESWRDGGTYPTHTVMPITPGGNVGIIDRGVQDESWYESPGVGPGSAIPIMRPIF